MAVDLDLINPSYKPALVALSAADVIAVTKDVLREMNYKALVAANHDDFVTRYNNVQFQLVLMDEQFGGNLAEGNLSLKLLQRMAMPQRRHCSIILFGHHFETLQPLQA